MSAATSPVGFVGLGNMGSVLAHNLVERGLRVLAHDAAGASRSPEGAEYAGSLADLARRAGTVVFSLPDGPASERVAREITSPTQIRTLAAVPSSTVRERGSMTRQILEEEMRRAGIAIRPAIEVEGREATFEMVAAGLGVGLVSAAEVGASANVHVLPIRDCLQRMTETLVCLREQGSRRIIEAFFEAVRGKRP